MKFVLAETAPNTYIETLTHLGKSEGLVTGIHPVVANVMWNRGIRTPEEAEKFLFPKWERDIHDPFLFNHMRRAVERIFFALEHGECVVLHGDYDADGVTGSSVLFETLRTVWTSLKGGQGSVDDWLSVYIPHREEEGYGLRMATVDKLKARGTNLIVTVDCGIASVAETEYAYALGMDVIVVDHHAMPPVLSTTAILIHPHVPGERYPFKPLAAVGVAYKLACAVIQEARQRGLAVPVGYEKWLLDYVAIATITDVVPLIGENRVLEKFGLLVMQKTRRPGFRALYRVAGIDPLAIDSQTIGFAIGPRINAAGRMKHAEIAFKALTALQDGEADVYAAQLQQANTERQQETEKMVEKALALVKDQFARAERDGALEKPKLVCIAHQGWPHGLVGLVASRMVNEFHVPAYVVGITERGLVGSGRSIPGFHVTDALKAHAHLLSRFGGHPQACGFTVKDEASLEPLFAGLRALAAETLKERSTEPEYLVDVLVKPEECTLTLAEQLQWLEPHGEGNAKPVLLIQQLCIKDARVIGKDQTHLKLTGVLPDGTTLDVMLFKQAKRLSEVPQHTVVDILGELSVNEWQGRRTAQVIARDFVVKK